MSNRIADVLPRSQRRYHRLITAAVVLVLVPVLVWPSVGWAVWMTRPVSELSVAVFDETVLDDTYREHRGLGLVLESLKVPFSISDGYIGAAPGGAPTGRWPDVRPDLVMLVDAYGVYENDLGELDPQGRHRVSGRLEAGDVLRIERWHNDGSWVYGETQILGTPTSPEARSGLEALFSIESTGWSGRWFDDLTAVPDSLRSGRWDYTGSGIVLASETGIVVLAGSDLTGHLPAVTGRIPGGSRFDVPFSNWFDVVTAEGTVDASLELPVTSEGAAKLASLGLPVRTPMIIRGPRSVYIAGDASDAAVSFPLRRVAGAASVMAALPQTVESAFFYRVYLPTVAWLIDGVEAGR